MSPRSPFIYKPNPRNETTMTKDLTSSNLFKETKPRPPAQIKSIISRSSKPAVMHVRDFQTRAHRGLGHEGCPLKLEQAGAASIQQGAPGAPVPATGARGLTWASAGRRSAGRCAGTRCCPSPGGPTRAPRPP